MKKVAIITGATGGIGTGFVKECAAMEDIDEVWAIGRNKNKLESLKSISPKIVTIEADLNADGVEILKGRLSQVQDEE